MGLSTAPALRRGFFLGAGRWLFLAVCYTLFQFVADVLPDSGRMPYKQDGMFRYLVKFLYKPGRIRNVLPGGPFAGFQLSDFCAWPIR